MIDDKIVKDVARDPEDETTETGAQPRSGRCEEGHAEGRKESRTEEDGQEDDD